MAKHFFGGFEKCTKNRCFGFLQPPFFQMFALFYFTCYGEKESHDQSNQCNMVKFLWTRRTGWDPESLKTVIFLQFRSTKIVPQQRGLENDGGFCVGFLGLESCFFLG